MLDREPVDRLELLDVVLGLETPLVRLACLGPEYRPPARGSPPPPRTAGQGPATSPGRKSTPSTPSSISSGNDPWAGAIEGTDADIASAITRPNGSCHCDGTTAARARARSAMHSSRHKSPGRPTEGLVLAHSLTSSSSGPPPAMTSLRFFGSKRSHASISKRKALGLVEPADVDDQGLVSPARRSIG